MNKFSVFYVALLTLILGFLLGEYRQHTVVMKRISGLIKHDMTVAQNQGFVIGCLAGIRSYADLGPNDPSNPLWTEWCVKTVGNYIDQSDSK